MPPQTFQDLMTQIIPVTCRVLSGVCSVITLYSKQEFFGSFRMPYSQIDAESGTAYIAFHRIAFSGKKIGNFILQSIDAVFRIDFGINIDFFLGIIQEILQMSRSDGIGAGQFYLIGVNAGKHYHLLLCPGDCHIGLLPGRYAQSRSSSVLYRHVRHRCHSGQL